MPRHDEKDFKAQYLGDFKVECDVRDVEGNHCPDPVEHMVELEDNQSIGLCHRCYVNFIQGVYMPRFNPKRRGARYETE